MGYEIKIEKKCLPRGEDGQKIVSVRTSNELTEKLDEIAAKANRSRNNVINLLLESAVALVEVEKSDAE